MKVMSNEYKDRLNHWINVLSADLYIPLQRLSLSSFHTMDQLSVEEAQLQDYSPIQTPYTWGNEWEYCWIKINFYLPPQAEGKRIAIDLSMDHEATVFVNGKAFGTYRAPWISCNYHYIVDNTICASGKAGTAYDLLIEAYAGHYIPQREENGNQVTGPIIPGTYEHTPANNDRSHIYEPTIGIWNEDAYQLLMDVKTLLSLMETVDSDSLRASKLTYALEEFTRVCEFEQPLDERIDSYKRARVLLKPLLECENGSTAPEFYAIGNSHLDLAWLWPMQETYRKTARTFAAQLRHIEEYPEYRYLQSQPASYEMCRQYYPELFERILATIKGGHWIADGAMWVEPDTNLSGGEALVRQLLYGIRYYRDVLGTESKVLWLPDSFGYSGALPQLLKKSGIDYMVTQKIFWSYNDGERFPYHFFKWEGIDGSKVTAFLPTSYTYETDPKSISDVWENRSQIRDLDSFLLPFGYGDGGGGPARDHIEYLMREKNLEGMPKVKMVSPKEFFEKMGEPKDCYRGELYFSAHRGTYTTQAKTKKNNRRCETALHNMETLGSIASLSGASYDMAAAEKLWKELLLHQFHDILPGSSIARVYVEAEVRMSKVIDESNRLSNRYAAAVTSLDSHAVSVFNTLSFARKELIELPDHFMRGAVDSNGQAVPVGIIDGKVNALVEIPSLCAITLYPSAEACLYTPATASQCEKGFVLENRLIKATVSAFGEVTSFVLKKAGREFAAEPMNRFCLYKDTPRCFDAWDIDSNYLDTEIIDAVNAHCEIISGTGLEAKLLRVGTVGNSTFTQEIILDAESERIEFRTKVEWNELHRLLKVSFPVNVYTNEGINEIQFGYVKHPVHRSRLYDKDRFEVCNHRYSVLSDEGHGAAVLNDCKYGISMNGNCLELTLLRAAASPAMRADNGPQEFTYGFFGFDGPFLNSGVVNQGLSLNTPLLVVEGASDVKTLVEISNSNIILDTLKPAEDNSGDLILRFYESLGAAATAKIHLGFGKQAWLCNLLEDNEEELPFGNSTLELNFGSFEIMNVRIKK